MPRPLGAVGKRTRGAQLKIASALKRFGAGDPLGFLVRVMANGDEDMALRIEAAAKLLPYVYSRPSTPGRPLAPQELIAMVERSPEPKRTDLPMQGTKWRPPRLPVPETEQTTVTSEYDPMEDQD